MSRCSCGLLLEWVDCWACGGEGAVEHDCGEDTCCCIDPKPNVICDVCDGDGGAYLCPQCER
jgi:hypothetical protein